MKAPEQPLATPETEAAEAKRGAWWPTLVFCIVAFFFAAIIPYLSFILANGGMQQVAQSFQEGGVFMYLLLLLSIFIVFIYCGLAYPHISMRLPSSLEVLPALLPLGVGLLGAKWGITMVFGALDQAAPEQVTAYAYRGLAMSMHPLVLGSFVAATAFGLAALSAAMRSFAWGKDAPKSIVAWIVLGVGLLAALVATIATSLGGDTLSMTLLLGASSMYAVVVIGLGSIIKPRTWRDGAGRLLLVFSALAVIVLTWIGLRGSTLALWAGVLDQAAPEQRASFIGMGMSMESQLNLAFWLHLAVVGLAGVGALATGGGKVLAGLAKFRVSAAVTTLFVIATVALAFSLAWKKDALFDWADQSDGTYFLRNNDEYQGARSTTREPGSRGRIPIVIINPDHIWVDDQRAVPTKGFVASNDPGLRAALKTNLDAWELRVTQERAEHQIQQEEIEDWVNQELSEDGTRSKADRHGRVDAKNSDNRFGIKGPADNPDPHIARERAKEYGVLGALQEQGGGRYSQDGPWGHLLKKQAPTPRNPWSLDAVNLAVHREVPFSTVREVVKVLRSLGFTSARFIVSTGTEPSAEARSNIPAELLRSPSDYGAIPFSFGPGQCSGRVGIEEVRNLEEALALGLEIGEAGFTLGASGGVLPEGCASSTEIPSAPGRPTVPLDDEASSCTDDRGYPSASQRIERTGKGLGHPPCAYDFDRLGECIVRIKEEYPDESNIIVSAASTVDFQVLVNAIDTARGETRRYYDEGQFTEVFLFLGDDLRRTCNPDVPRGVADYGEMGAPIGLGRGYGRGAGGLKGRGASVPTIRTGTAAVRGSLSKEVIRRYIRRHINQIRYCYEQQLAVRPDLSGRVSVRFVISPSGAVSTSSVAGSTLGNPAAEACVARAVQRIAFPQPEGGGVVIVTYPFMFQSAEAP